MSWHTTFGEVAVRESVWRLPVPGGGYHRPFAARARVTARGCSRRLARAAADFGCEQSFARAGAQLWEHYGVRLGASTLRELTLRQARAIAARAAGAGPARALPKRGKAAVVVAEADGTMLPVVEPRATAQSRDKRKCRPVRWQEARLAAAQAQGGARAHFGATLEGGVEEVGARWGQAAKAAGWGLDGRVHAVGDGAPWLAEQAKSQFGKQGGYLLDFFHVSEYLAAAAAGLHPGDAPAAKAWLLAQQQALKANQSAAVLARLAAASEPAEVPEERAPARCAHRYLSNRPDQLDYAGALAADLPIGSGLIEAGHRHVLHARLKVSGAWWLPANAEAMIQARVARANGQWAASWKPSRPGKQPAAAKPPKSTPHF